MNDFETLPVGTAARLAALERELLAAQTDFLNTREGLKKLVRWANGDLPRLNDDPSELLSALSACKRNGLADEAAACRAERLAELDQIHILKEAVRAAVPALEYLSGFAHETESTDRALAGLKRALEGMP